VAILQLPEERSFQLLRGGTLKSHKFLLVMKSYMHVRLAITETHYHNLNTNIKNQVYWLLTSNVGINNTKGTKLQHGAIFPHFGQFQFGERYKVKTTVWYTLSNSISWLPSD
jgi:hypothetical protein